MKSVFYFNFLFGTLNGSCSFFLKGRDFISHLSVSGQYCDAVTELKRGMGTGWAGGLCVHVHSHKHAHPLFFYLFVNKRQPNKEQSFS